MHRKTAKFILEKHQFNFNFAVKIKYPFYLV